MSEFAETGRSMDGRARSAERHKLPSAGIGGLVSDPDLGRSPRRSFTRVVNKTQAQ